jgi:excisionase family DNA binding protein
MQNPERLAAAIAEFAAAISESSAPGTEESERLLNIPEATKALGVGRTKVYDLIGAGQLRTLHVGRRVLVPSSAVRDFIAGPDAPEAA